MDFERMSLSDVVSAMLPSASPPVRCQILVTDHYRGKPMVSKLVDVLAVSRTMVTVAIRDPRTLENMRFRRSDGKRVGSSAGFYVARQVMAEWNKNNLGAA